MQVINRLPGCALDLRQERKLEAFATVATPPHGEGTIRR